MMKSLGRGWKQLEIIFTFSVSALNLASNLKFCLLSKTEEKIYKAQDMLSHHYSGRQH